MRNLIVLTVCLLLCAFPVSAQFQVNGDAAANPNGFNEFLLTPAQNNSRGSVFNQQAIDLTQNFQLTAELYFGSSEASGDGMAFVLQREGASYLGDAGQGLGYNRLNNTSPSPVPSFIIEFDTYQNISVGDPAADHLAFLSYSNSSHQASTA